MANTSSSTLVLAGTGKTGVPPASFADFARRTARAWARQGAR
jgi:hypothetical protein